MRRFWFGMDAPSALAKTTAAARDLSITTGPGPAGSAEGTATAVPSFWRRVANIISRITGMDAADMAARRAARFGAEGAAARAGTARGGSTVGRILAGAATFARNFEHWSITAKLLFCLVLASPTLVLGLAVRILRRRLEALVAAEHEVLRGLVDEDNGDDDGEEEGGEED